MNKNIGIVFKHNHQGDFSLLRQCADIFLKNGANVLLEKESCSGLSPEIHGLELVSTHDMAEQSDLIVSIGGDGTLLGAIRNSLIYGRPVIGFNLGTLGFLTPILPEHMEEAVPALINGDFSINEREVLYAKITGPDSERFDEGLAINDVTVKNELNNRVCNLRVEVDGNYLTTFKGDGLVVSTPTGSTAYSLSAGGSILHPGLSGIILAPICPHSLTQRPIVIPSSSEVKISSENGEKLIVCPDGIDSIAPNLGSDIFVKKNNTSANVIELDGYNFYENLKTKLNWG